MRGYTNSRGEFIQVLHGNKAIEMVDGKRIEYEVKDYTFQSLAFPVETNEIDKTNE